MTDSRDLTLANLPDDLWLTILPKMDPVSMYFLLLTNKRFHQLSTHSTAIWESVNSSLFFSKFAQPEEHHASAQFLLIQFLNQLFQVSYLIPSLPEQTVIDTNAMELSIDDDFSEEQKSDYYSYQANGKFGTPPFSDPAEKTPIQLLIFGISLRKYYKQPSADLLPLFLRQDRYGRNAIDWAIFKGDQLSLDFIFQCVSLTSKQKKNDCVVLPDTFIWHSKITPYFNPKYKSLEYYFKLKTKLEWAAQCNQIDVVKKSYQNHLRHFSSPGSPQTEFFNFFQYYSSVLTITAHEGHLELMQFILSKIPNITDDDMLISAITAAVTGGQSSTLNVLLDIAKDNRVFDDERCVKALFHVVRELVFYPLQSGVGDAIYLLLRKALLPNNAELKCNQQIDLFTLVLDRFPYQAEKGYFNESNEATLSGRVQRAIKTHDFIFLKQVIKSDLLKKYKVDPLLYYYFFDMLEEYFIFITMNFEDISQDKMKMVEIKKSLTELKKILSDLGVIPDDVTFGTILFGWIFSSLIWPRGNQPLLPFEKTASFEVWERSLDFILSFSLIPEEDFLSSLFQLTHLYYCEMVTEVETDYPEKRTELYIKLLLFLIKKGLNVPQFKEDSYGTDTLLSINLVNEHFLPINELLLHGAQMTFEDYFAEIRAIEYTFKGFMCNSIMVDDKTNFKSSIKFKPIPVIHSEQIHPDFFVICMNFDMISALVHFITMYYAQRDIAYEYYYEIDSYCNDFEIALKSLQYELAKSIPFAAAYKNWFNDPFNREVMSRPDHAAALDAIRYLLENYNQCYQECFKLYAHRIVQIDKNKASIDDDTQDMNCEANLTQLNSSEKFFDHKNSRKRDLASSQTTDQVMTSSLVQTTTININEKTNHKKPRS